MGSFLPLERLAFRLVPVYPCGFWNRLAKASLFSFSTFAFGLERAVWSNFLSVSMVFHLLPDSDAGKREFPG